MRIRLLISMALLAAAPGLAQVITHPPVGVLADLGTCDASREGLLFSVTNGDDAADCDPTGAGDETVLCKCTETATSTYEWQAVPNVDEDGNLTLAGSLTVARSDNPGTSYRDAQGTDSDVNFRLYGNATDTGSGTEDMDIWLAGQRAGAEVNHITIDADGGITLGNAGNGSLTVTTDSTGDGEVVLPDDSIGADEIGALPADAVDALTEISQSIKSAANDTDPLAVFTGGAPGSTQCVQVNTSGQLSATGSACGSGGGGYATIDDEDSALTQRTVLNFEGAGVTCADDTDQTTCTIPGGGGGGGTNVRLPLLNAMALPDTSGNAFFETYTTRATNDFFAHQVLTFLDDAADGCVYVVADVPATASSGFNLVTIWTSAATTGNFDIEFAYRSIGGDDTESLDQATAVETVSAVDAAPSATDERMVSTIALTDSNLAAGDTLQGRFCRDATSDTIADEVSVFGVYLEYDE